MILQKQNKHKKGRLEGKFWVNKNSYHLYLFKICGEALTKHFPNLSKPILWSNDGCKKTWGSRSEVMTPGFEPRWVWRQSPYYLLTTQQYPPKCWKKMAEEIAAKASKD